MALSSANLTEEGGLGYVRKVAESGNKPVTQQAPPQSMLQLLPPDSYLELLPRLPSMMDCDPEVSNEINPSFSKLFLIGVLS